MPSRETLWRKYHTEQQTERLVRKVVKKNRKPDRVRKREWRRVDANEPDAWEDGDAGTDVEFERVMPKGERERRKSVIALALAADGDRSLASSHGDDHYGVQGLVIEVSTANCRVDVAGRQLLCGLRGALSAEESGFTNVVAAGDQVIVSEGGEGRGIVESVLPRRTILARPDVYDRHLRQVVVANAEQLVIVQSWREPAVWPELIDRYLIAAGRNGLEAALCINKMDLASDERAVRSVLKPYFQQGLRVIPCSALRGDGIEDLRRVLAGRITALAGLSGVGKSTLLTAVQPSLRLRTAETSARHHEGRHTTSQVTMWKLDIGGYVVDTPGIREFGLIGLQRNDVVRFYPEIARAAALCRFSDCQHQCEPGCAVRDAIAREEISGERFHSYCNILAHLDGQGGS